ncbi:MAG: hypothetical protein PV358_01925 [Acidimicrobiales bacterium]|nr:hypothetical protein [Acidimicrobiales bacterium]
MTTRPERVGAGPLFVMEHGFRRLPVPDFWHPVIGSPGFALVGLLVPRALGVGYDAIEDVIDGRLAVGAVAALLLASWWPGGSPSAPAPRAARSPPSC